MKPEAIIKAVVTIRARQDKYDEINRALRDMAGDGQAPVVQCIDEQVFIATVAALDEALEHITGMMELASYYIWERPTDGLIGWPYDDKQYRWSNADEFAAAVKQIIEYKEQSKQLGD